MKLALEINIIFKRIFGCIELEMTKKPKKNIMILKITSKFSLEHSEPAN